MDRDDIDALFAPDQAEALASYLRLLHPADVAELFRHVQPSRWAEISGHLTDETLGEALTELDESMRERLGEVLNTARLIEVVDELETDDAADVLADLPEEKSVAVLDALEDQDEIRTLLAYDDESAGGIMQTELCRVEQGKRVSDAIEAVRTATDEIEDIYEVWVTDEGGRLVGSVALQDLVISKPDTLLREIRVPTDATVTVDVDQEEVAELFKKYDLASLPVVDTDGVLMGRITFDDIHDVLVEEASEDIMTMAGASTEELVYGSQIFRIAMFRLPWLVSSLFGSLITTQLVPMFSNVKADTIVLTAFVPVVMAMTGNVGSQSAMIITRGFAIGMVDFQNLGRTFFRETAVGIIMGMSAGILVGLFAQVVYGNPVLGLALGLSVTGSMTAATLAGVATPAVFKWLGLDPALGAGPLVTTGCDVMGVSAYLLVAFLVLG